MKDKLPQLTPPTTSRTGFGGRDEYPVQIWVTLQTLRIAEGLVRKSGFEGCGSRSAVLGKWCERLTK